MVGTGVSVLHAQDLPDLPVEAFEGIPAEAWIRAGIIFLVSIGLWQLIKRLLSWFAERRGAEHAAALVVGRSVGYVVLAVGGVYALSTLDVSVGPLLGALGVGGLALALASQDALRNLIAGIVLQVRRPFRPGDQIHTNDYEGTVERVNLRVVTLRSFDGELVYIPNGQVLHEPIANRTALGRRRTTLAVGVAYDTDLSKARQVLLQAVTGVEGVLEQPGAEAYVEAFGDSSVNFALRFWHAPENASMWRVRDAVARAVKSALDAEGIVIPFPQRRLWFSPPPEPS